MNTTELTRLLESFEGRRVLVFGDVMLDEYIWGDVRRISPEAPVPIVELNKRTYLAGGAANVANNLNGLGAETSLIGVVGEDFSGKTLVEEMGKAKRVNCLLFKDHTRPTTIKTRVIAHSQHVVRIDAEVRAPIPNQLAAQMLHAAFDLLPNVEVCILSDYGKGVVDRSVAEQFIRSASNAGKTVIVDPKGIDYSKYRGATVIKPNVHEAASALNRNLINDSDLLQAGKDLMETLDGTSVLVTRGAEGMSLFQAGKSPVHIPTAARNVYDVTGAGDTVVSTLALSIASGASLEVAAKVANLAAGVVVGKVGTTIVTRREMLNFNISD